MKFLYRALVLAIAEKLLNSNVKNKLTSRRRTRKVRVNGGRPPEWVRGRIVIGDYIHMPIIHR